MARVITSSVFRHTDARNHHETRVFTSASFWALSPSHTLVEEKQHTVLVTIILAGFGIDIYQLILLEAFWVLTWVGLGRKPRTAHQILSYIRPTV